MTTGAAVQIEPRTEAFFRIVSLQDRLDLQELIKTRIEEFAFPHRQAGDAAASAGSAAARSRIAGSGLRECGSETDDSEPSADDCSSTRLERTSFEQRHRRSPFSRTCSD